MVHASPVEVTDDAIRATLTVDDYRKTIYLRSHGAPIGSPADSLATLAVLPAMRSNVTLRLSEDVSPRLAATLPRAQEVIAGFDRVWDAGYAIVPIAGQSRSAVAAPAAGIACLFSGGADSFYSALKHRDRVTHLLFVHGFDIPLANDELRRAAAAAARAAADHLGVELIEVETDLREVFDELGIDWRHAHGAALASVALLFQDILGEVIVPATFNYGTLEPWGTHPLLDPLWSTERTAFTHDGCEAPRPAKLAAIARDEVAMANLRVCWENRDGLYNCGRCEKCVRTMISLRIAGALERCTTLPDELDLDAVSKIPVYRRDFLIHNLSAIATMDEPDHDLEAALREALGRYDARHLDAGRELAAIKGSRSWRLTAPLRRAGAAARRTRSKA